MTRDDITARLFELQDTKYRDFQAKLIPGVTADSVIGVRTPALRAFAKELYKAAASDRETAKAVSDFLSSLPHKYFDQNQLHAFLIGEEKDFEKCISRVEAFLPYVDNWATCDQASTKAFTKHKSELLPYIFRWIKSNHTYTVRFAIGKLMQLFLDEDFKPQYLEIVAAVRSDEYYINMMIAWYFATALAKQYEAALPYIEKNRLEKWTHNKAIQKAIESYRISDEQKAYLRTLKVK